MSVERRPRTIKLDASTPFEEEPLPQMTLLHVRFRDNYENAYRWTPRIRGGEVERVFFKMLEVEERNSPDGVWSDELRKASEHIASLRDFKLPVTVTCSGLTQQLKDDSWAYRMEVSICSQDESVFIPSGDVAGATFAVGQCTLHKAAINEALFKEVFGRWGVAVDSKVRATYCQASDSPFANSGVRFYVWLPQGISREDIQMLAREIAGTVRACIRRVLLDYKALTKGFDEPEG